MIDIPQKVINQLKSKMWYHGTLHRHFNSFIKDGIIVDRNKINSDSLDFGYGFYLTNKKEKAEDFITRMYNNGTCSDSDMPIVLGFEFCPYDLVQDDQITFKCFQKYDDEFSNFVFQNRTTNFVGDNQHSYDIIYGVMSDSIPTKLIAEYNVGLLSEEDVKIGLKKPCSMKQISLHKQSICDILQLKEAYIIDPIDRTRKELCINGE